METAEASDSDDDDDNDGNGGPEGITSFDDNPGTSDGFGDLVFNASSGQSSDDVSERDDLEVKQRDRAFVEVELDVLG